jgi:O-antigen/teichoic acid export membrane protein
VAAGLIGSVIFTIMFRKKVIPAFRKLSGYFATGVKKLLSRGIFFFFTSLGWNLLNSLDRILIKFYLPAKELGYYSISILFITVLAAFSSTMGQALIPSLTAVRAQSNDEAFRRQIINTSRIGFMIIVPVVVMTYVLAEDLIMILLPDFGPAVVLVQILIFIGIFDLVNHVAKASIVACDRGGWLAATYIFCAGWNVVWNIILIPRMGLEGAALASLSSYVILAVVLHLLMTRFSGVRLKISHLLMPLLFSGIYLLLKWVLPELGHLPELLVTAAAGTALYLLLLIIGGMIRSGDIRRSRESILARKEAPHVRMVLKGLSVLEVLVRKLGRG